MDPIETWWEAVRPETREWLGAHLREFLDSDVAVDIVRHGGGVGGAHVSSDAGPPSHFAISEDDWRWIENLTTE